MFLHNLKKDNWLLYVNFTPRKFAKLLLVLINRPRSLWGFLCRQSSHMWIMAAIFLDNLSLFFFLPFLLFRDSDTMLARKYFWTALQRINFGLCFLSIVFKNTCCIDLCSYLYYFFVLFSLYMFCFCFSTFLVRCLAYAYQNHSKISLHIHYIVIKADKNAGKHMKQWQLSEISSRNVYWYNHFEKQIEI